MTLWDSLISDSLGWLCHIKVSFQVTESTVATKNLYSFLFYRVRCDTKVLKTRKSWILHVCFMKLENRSTLQIYNLLCYYSEKNKSLQSVGSKGSTVSDTILKVTLKSWFSHPCDFVRRCPWLEGALGKKPSNEAVIKKQGLSHD